MVTCASHPFQVFVKPAGALCNLECSYCYYLKKQHLFPTGSSSRMTDDLLEHYIIQHIEVSPGEVVSFSWMRFVVPASFGLVVLDAANHTIPHLRRGHAFVETDTAGHPGSRLPGDAGIPHRAFYLVRAKLFFPS